MNGYGLIWGLLAVLLALTVWALWDTWKSHREDKAAYAAAEEKLAEEAPPSVADELETDESPWDLWEQVMKDFGDATITENPQIPKDKL